MAKDYIGYEKLADQALRSVVREALKRVEKQGLIGSHHFYITFKTHDPGVEMPDFLRERYPDEITIVMQHQYWGLNVEEDKFSITLTFQKMPADLVVPYAALTAFVDPSVQFGLQFKNGSAAVQNAAGPKSVPAKAAESPPAIAKPEPAPAQGGESSSGPQVVSLDKFRKK